MHHYRPPPTASSLAPKGKLAVSRSLALASDSVLLTAWHRLSSRCVESDNHRIKLAAFRHCAVDVQSNTSLVGEQLLSNDAVLLH
jgi:hypothetical protein